MSDVRKLVSVRVIDELFDIAGADAIVAARVGGWVSVVKRGEFVVGERVLFFEIDSFLPASVDEFAFLSGNGGKKFLSPGGVEVVGAVLKTVRLRGQVSQGLILPLAFGLSESSSQDEINEVVAGLGVFKYEKPVPVGSSAEIVGGFPGLLMKTDSERVQNLSDEFLGSLVRGDWFASEKVDGMSASFWKQDGVLRAASRNWEVSLEGSSAHSVVAKAYDLASVIPEGGFVQGEIFGEKVQGNPLKLKGLTFAVFSHGVFGDEAIPEAVHEFDVWAAEHAVPRLGLVLPVSTVEAVAQVDGLVSVFNPSVQAEGVVWWNTAGELFNELGGRANFKAINNQFLMKHGG